MKKKKLSKSEYEDNLKPAEKLTFSDKSFSESITLPKSAIGSAMHGNLTVHGAQGTIYVIREGAESSSLVKIDEYSFNGKRSEEVEVVGPLITEHHHLTDLPEFIKNSSPNWLIELVKRIRSRLEKLS